MIKKCKKLHLFGIERHTATQSVGRLLGALTSQATSLQNLKLYPSMYLANRCILLNNLEKLDVGNASNVNDRFLEVVAKSCKKLTYLDLRREFEYILKNFLYNNNFYANFESNFYLQVVTK